MWTLPGWPASSCRPFSAWLQNSAGKINWNVSCPSLMMRRAYSLIIFTTSAVSSCDSDPAGGFLCLKYRSTFARLDHSFEALPSSGPSLSSRVLEKVGLNNFNSWWFSWFFSQRIYRMGLANCLEGLMWKGNGAFLNGLQTIQEGSHILIIRQAVLITSSPLTAMQGSPSASPLALPQW